MLGTNKFKRILLVFWYKHAKHLDIIGFYAGVPIIRSKYLEPDKEVRQFILDEFANYPSSDIDWKEISKRLPK